MQNCRRKAWDKIVSMNRWTDRQTDRQTNGHENCICTTSYTQKHYVQISEQYLQKYRSNALDNNDLVKFTSSGGDNSATNDSMIMKIAHAELYTISNTVCNFEFSTCITVRLFLWTTIIQ